jgi:hypothetical protein
MTGSNILGRETVSDSELQRLFARSFANISGDGRSLVLAMNLNEATVIARTRFIALFTTSHLHSPNIEPVTKRKSHRA